MKTLSVCSKFDIWRLFVVGDFCGLGLQSALEAGTVTCHLYGNLSNGGQHPAQMLVKRPLGCQHRRAPQVPIQCLVTLVLGTVGTNMLV